MIFEVKIIKIGNEINAKKTIIKKGYSAMLYDLYF